MKSNVMMMEEAKVITPPESVLLQKSSLIFGYASKLRILLTKLSIFSDPLTGNALQIMKIYTETQQNSSRFEIYAVVDERWIAKQLTIQTKHLREL